MSAGESYDSRGAGLGFAGGLTLLFVGLKLTHVIDWSWWWVTAPLWISAAFGLAVFLMAWLVLRGME